MSKKKDETIKALKKKLKKLKAEVEALIAKDPFTIEGVFATTTIIPWKQVAP